MYKSILGHKTYTFSNLKDLLAKASPTKSGDALAGLIASSLEERVAAKMALAELPLKKFLEDLVIPYEEDEVTRLIIDLHDKSSFLTISHMTVGDLRDYLLTDECDSHVIHALKYALTPEMVSAVSKLMRNQDLIQVASKIQIVTQFRTTVGLKDRFSTRLQPNHPSDNPKGILASTIDGLSYANGDAMIGINPATDNIETARRLLNLTDELRNKYKIPTQSCILTHITNTIELIQLGEPVDLVFQSIGGTEKVNKSFGVNLSLLQEGWDAGLSLKRNQTSKQLMYFETGQGSALSANAHHGVDQQTCEVRAYAVARNFDPFLVNTVVGFIGPEYLYNGKQITRAGLEDHFCAKVLGLPMGCDICYTNHADADQDDMDNLLSLLGLAGCNFIMGIPGADDIMLNYQSTSFHDALYLRKILNKKPAPEFELWLEKMGIYNQENGILSNAKSPLLVEELS
ncbi:MAG: ethanolamine ammonia-lyase subunit EutB [Leptospiraceae bacterium]|jgi:ethanolamine ammonia-lyase large subunit|nr:ethanolamine ammonia-lyase subunit EutB [Leptospiraceae bacterium]MCZ8345519.1 ethanolamine ammonia-lyase subunit EutB [Leptospiraceae bacterium]